jgi:hypothetical protein
VWGVRGGRDDPIDDPDCRRAGAQHRVHVEEVREHRQEQIRDATPDKGPARA